MGLLPLPSCKPELSSEQGPLALGEPMKADPLVVQSSKPEIYQLHCHLGCRDRRHFFLLESRCLLLLSPQVAFKQEACSAIRWLPGAWPTWLNWF